MAGCLTDKGGKYVHKELCHQQIDMDTPLAVFLPTNKETGLCTYALLDMLYRKQNEFLEMYGKLTKRQVHIFVVNPLWIHWIKIDKDATFLLSSPILNILHFACMHI